MIAGTLIALLGTAFVQKDRIEVPRPAARPASSCLMQVKRAKGYSTIGPLLTSEPVCASARFNGMYEGIIRIVETFRNEGAITSAAVYLRDLNRSEWTAYNGGQLYEPGSLMKVPLLMTYLRMNQEDPTVMNRKYSLSMKAKPPSHTYFPPGASIVPGQLYRVSELLDFAIGRSDNMAVIPLLQHLDVTQFHKTYTDLGLRDFGSSDPSYPMNVRDYSMFMKVLYNASYLGISDSKVAIDHLMRSDFALGIRAGLPAGIKAAGKFGESGDINGMQLHETAIVYADFGPFVLTIMSQGPSMDQLPGFIRTVTSYVYEELARMNATSQVQ